MKATIETESGRRLVEIRYYPGSEEWARDIFNLIKKGFPLLEEKIGVPCPTPWDIRITEVTNLEEGVGAVNKGPDGIEVPPDTSPSTIIHELCHYWFRHEPRSWSLEGFPEAYTIQVLKELGHSEAYSHWYDRLDMYEAAKAEIGDKPLIKVGYHPDFTDPRVALMYAKATVFSTWLILYLGEETMHKINQVVVFEDRIFSEDYQEIAEEAAGKDLDWLFSGWVFEGEYYYDGESVSFEWFAGDGDKDGIDTFEEIEMGLSPFNPDTDGDGLPDGQELFLKTDLNDPDTDDDQLKDGEEVSIIMDGKKSEWTIPIIKDDKGDSELPGSQDIKAVYYATDDTYLYFMIEFYTKPSTAYHTGVEFDIGGSEQADFIFFSIYDHVNVSIWDNGEWVETVSDPNLLKGAAVISNQVMEFRIPKRMHQVTFPDSFKVWVYEYSVAERKVGDKTYAVTVSTGQNPVRSTNPRDPDTDGDGLLDGEDPEPLVAQEEPTETEPPQETEEPQEPEKEPQEPGPQESPSEKETPFTGWVVLLGMVVVLLLKRLHS